VRAPPPASLGTSCYPSSFIIDVLYRRLRPHLSEFLGASLFYREHLGPEHLLVSFLQHEHKKGLTKTNVRVLAIALPVTLMSLDALERERERGREGGREGEREGERESERAREGGREGEGENFSGVWNRCREYVDRFFFTYKALQVNAAGSPPSIFACGGNSHTARIVDVREGGGVKGGVTWTAADSAVSFVQWSPADENVLISCRCVCMCVCLCVRVCVCVFL
jgi:hypothetical protein